MKRIINILIVIFIAASTLSGCSPKNAAVDSSTKETSSMQNDIQNVSLFEETFDTPTKVVYQRNHFYSAVFETEDPAIISDILSAFNKVTITSEVNTATDDYDDIITFVAADGSKYTVHFEYKYLLKNDKRYEITGYDEVMSVVSKFAPEDSEGA